MAHYKTIIFDLSEVLLDFVVPLGDDLARRLSTTRERIYRAFENDHMEPYYRGLISEDEFLHTVMGDQLQGITLPEMKQIIRRSLDMRVPDMQPILEDLKHDYELVLLSDHGREWVDYILQKHPFLDIFERKFFSFDLDGIKEHPETFIKLLERLGRRPQECLFIDDMEHNCATARSLGIDAIRFTSAEDLKADLGRLGIQV